MATAAVNGVVGSELDEVLHVRSTPRLARRHLLQVLHATRALDTTLRAFLQHHGMLTKDLTGLGKYLHHLEKQTTNPTLGKLTETERKQFIEEIVRVRNHYLHGAGRFPADDVEVAKLLAAMDACLARVVAL